MSRKKNANRHPQPHKSQRRLTRHRMKALVIGGLILCLGLTSVILAGWRATHVAGTGAMLASPVPTPTSSLAPSNPSKEYIYAGGKLVATEEPLTAATPTPSPTPTPTPSPTPPNRVNVALAANGGQASASSTYSSTYPAENVNNGDELGLNWLTGGGGWNDAPPANTFSGDWLEIDFNGTKRIDEIDLFNLQDNYASPGTPTPTMTFSSYGLTSFDVQYWTGSAWAIVPGGQVTGNNLVWRKFTFSTAVTTTKIRVLPHASPDGMSRIVELEAWGTDAGTNVALSANGAVATASSTYGTGYEAGGAINGDAKGLNWGAGGGWNDAPPVNTFSNDWLEVDFNGDKTIHEVDLFMVQDAYANPGEPNPSMTFTNYGLTSFDVLYWDGSTWATVPGGQVTGNNLVWKQITFSPLTTSKIKVVPHASADGMSRLVELQAWGTDAPSTGTNVALSTNGATASASSQYPYDSYPAGGANNGDRRGLNWGAGGGWNDAGPANSFPDWLEVDFSGPKTIHEVDVFSLQDSYWAPGVVTSALTFSYYGLTDFKVQYWDGSAWADIPGAGAAGNNLVWRRFNFSDITTQKIRVWCTGSADGWSRLTEVEAWGY